MVFGADERVLTGYVYTLVTILTLPHPSPDWRICQPLCPPLRWPPTMSTSYFSDAVPKLAWLVWNRSQRRDLGWTVSLVPRPSCVELGNLTSGQWAKNLDVSKTDKKRRNRVF